MAQKLPLRNSTRVKPNNKRSLANTHRDSIPYKNSTSKRAMRRKRGDRKANGIWPK